MFKAPSPHRHADVMLQVLADLDVDTFRSLWSEVFPHLPPVKDDTEALVAIHLARTASDRTATEKRLYSHDWLIERGLPSQLPNELKRSSERVIPRTVTAVGLAVKARNPENAGAALIIRGEMERAVLEAEADGRLNDDDHVRQRVQEARRKIRKQLFGA